MKRIMIKEHCNGFELGFWDKGEVLPSVVIKTIDEMLKSVELFFKGDLLEYSVLLDLMKFDAEQVIIGDSIPGEFVKEEESCNCGMCRWCDEQEEKLEARKGGNEI